MRLPLVIQWLRLHAPKAQDPGSIPGHGTRSHMPQLKIPCATTKTWHKQINTFFKKKEKYNIEINSRRNVKLE